MSRDEFENWLTHHPENCDCISCKRKEDIIAVGKDLVQTQLPPATELSGHQDFEAVAREISRQYHARGGSNYPSLRRTLEVAILSALRSAVEAERETCAQIADFGVKYHPKESFSPGWQQCANETSYLIGKAIRARGAQVTEPKSQR